MTTHSLSDRDLSSYRKDIADMLSCAYRNIIMLQHERHSLSFSFILDPLDHAQRDAAYIDLDIGTFVAAIEREYPSVFFLYLDEAVRAVQEGDDDTLEQFLRNAGSCASQLQEDAQLEALSRFASVKAEAYNTLLSLNLDRAVQHAQDGEAKYFSGFEFDLKRARYYAEALSRDISAIAVEIETIGYRNGVPAYLRKAEQNAREGRIDFESMLECAVYCAGKSGISIDAERIAAIKAEGYRNSIERGLNKATALLRTADSLKSNDSLFSIKCRVGEAEQYAWRAGIDITERITAFYHSEAYRPLVERMLRDIQQLAERDHVQWRDRSPYVFCLLNQCEEYAKPAGIDISAKVAVIERIIVGKVQALLAKENCNVCRDFLESTARSVKDGQ